jgi:hypothetical protein
VRAREHVALEESEVVPRERVEDRVAGARQEVRDDEAVELPVDEIVGV